MSTPSAVGIARSERCLRHRVAGHPERPERLEAIEDRLHGDGLTPAVSALPVRMATEDELLLVHSPALVDTIKTLCARPSGGWLTPDTPVCPESHHAALWAAGCALSAVDAVLRGNVQSAFALCRPPGHHANRDQARGFCLYNNVALAAAYAQAQYALDSIAILDWDLHHGNGTQHIFYAAGRVSFVSLHVYGPSFYPGSGALEEMGDGDGLGHNLNLPLPPGCGDDDYQYVFESLVAPALCAWRPQLLLVSAGFDAHKDDPFQAMQLTSAGFYRLAKMAAEFAREAGIGLVLVLEGGYNLQALGESVAESVKGLLGLGLGVETPPRAEPSAAVAALVERGRRTFAPYSRSRLEPRAASRH
jgi:acetoin utilization deacetylase AcuC-like enzyme